MLFSTLSGALRKWFIPSEAVGNLVLFLQLMFPYLIILFIPVFKALNRKFSAVLIIYTLALIILALNPLNHTYFHGLLGILLHLGFWFLIFIYLSTPEDVPIQTLSKAFILLFVFELILGVFQYSLPKNHIINQYAVDEVTNIATVGSAVRVSGTFSYISGYSAFLIFGGLVLWGLARLKTTSWVILLLGGGGFLASLMNGSRSIIVIFSILFFYSFLSIPNYKIKVNLFLIMIVVAFLSIAFIGPSSLQFVESTVDNFMTRVESNQASGEQSKRIFEPLSDLQKFLDQENTFLLNGLGLGSTYQGANAIWGTSPYLAEVGYYEGELGRIFIEGGLILLFLKIFLFGVLFIDSNIPRSYLLPFLGLTFFYIPIVFNIYNLVFLFLGLAFVDKAYYLTSDRKNLRSDKQIKEHVKT